MATATIPKTNEIRLEYGVPQIVAFKFLQAKAFEGTFGTRALFTLADERRMWLDAEDGSEIEQNLRALGVQRGELVRLTKIKYPRGGGHAIRVERVAEQYDAPAGDDTADKLAQSIAIAQAQGARAFQRNAHVLPAATDASTAINPAAAGNRDSYAQDNAVAQRLMSCYMQALEAIREAQAFATRNGMGITFTNDNANAAAITLYIQHEKAMMEVRR